MLLNLGTESMWYLFLQRFTEFLDCDRRTIGERLHPTNGRLSKNCVALQRVKDIMQARGHFLFRGEVWFLYLQSQCTKTKLEAVDKYIGTLAANPDNVAILFDRMQFLIKVMGDERCGIIPQVELDVDTIEVNRIYLVVTGIRLENQQCLSLNSRFTT